MLYTIVGIASSQGFGCCHWNRHSKAHRFRCHWKTTVAFLADEDFAIWPCGICEAADAYDSECNRWRGDSSTCVRMFRFAYASETHAERWQHSTVFARILAAIDDACVGRWGFALTLRQPAQCIDGDFRVVWSSWDLFWSQLFDGAASEPHFSHALRSPQWWVRNFSCFFCYALRYCVYCVFSFETLRLVLTVWNCDLLVFSSRLLF